MYPPLLALALVAKVLARDPHHRAEPTGRTYTITYTNYDFPAGTDGVITAARHDCDQHDDADQRAHHHRPVYTNARRAQYHVDTKHVEKVDLSADRGGVVFYDNINYDETPPFTNKNRPETEEKTNENTRVNSTGPSTPPGATHGDRSPHKSSGSSVASPTTTRPNGTSTEAEFSLEDRVAFTGDQCPTGYAKVNGKCVEVQ